MGDKDDNGDVCGDDVQKFHEDGGGDDDYDYDYDQEEESDGYDDNIEEKFWEDAEVVEDDEFVSNRVNSSRGGNLDSLYRPPFDIMFYGSFEMAKQEAKLKNKWVLVNIQSNKEFSSDTLNSDTWSDHTVVETIKSNFIFWQVYDDAEEGRKVCTFYKLESFPVVMVVDPITGQKMCILFGMVRPKNLLEDYLTCMDESPIEHCINLSRKRSHQDHEDEENGPKEVKDNGETETEVRGLSIYPPLPPEPEEPKVDANLVCRVGVRLPDGNRIRRSFLLSDSVQLLWSFCSSKLEEAQTKPFQLSLAIPGSCMSLEYETNSTFQESDLANCMLSFAWK